MAGIKQGLPLSPWLFLFYINDIFDYFDGIFGRDGLLETLHILVQADDTTILASSREKAEQKFKSMLAYCRLNHISLQVSKCKFIVINGDESDYEPLVFENEKIENVPFLPVLGSHLSQSGKLEDDLDLHMSKRYVAVHKFFNFIRANKVAPIQVKLKVLEACVASSLLHNCETFGSKIPKQLETIYFSLIKCCLGVRSNTPNKLVLIESGMPTLESLIYSRQHTFFTKFIANLKENSARKLVFDGIQDSGCDFLDHYINLLNSYHSKDDIRTHFSNNLTNEVNTLAGQEDKYKFQLYKRFNPDLTPLEFYKTHFKFPRLRLSSHSMPVETGRWRRIPREERLCTACNTLGDEEHYIYTCPEIDRSNLDDIPELHELQHFSKLSTLIERLENYL